ncbi:MAG: CAP domain-containing protein [Anaerolineae bacterium]
MDGNNRTECRKRTLFALTIACLFLLGCALPARLRSPSGTPWFSGALVTAEASATDAHLPGVVRTVIITVDAFSAAVPTPLGAEDLRALAERSFAAVNAERAALGLAALEWDEDLYDLSLREAGYLGQNHLFSHWLPDDPSITVASLFDGNGPCGENLALHYSPEAVGSEDWSESPPHHAIAIDAGYLRGAAAIATVQEYVRVFSPPDSSYGAQDETVQFTGTEYILVFRACR